MANFEPEAVDAYKTSDGQLYTDLVKAREVQTKLNAELDLQEWLLMNVNNSEGDEWEEEDDELVWENRRHEDTNMEEVLRAILNNRKSLLRVLKNLESVNEN